MKILFISGAEGVGKSTIISGIKKKLKKAKIYDFDGVGVPLNPPLSWRHKTTKHWLKISEKNEKLGKDTIIVGLSFPSEILRFSKRKEIKFILLDISIKEREKRLKKRKASKEVIKDTNQLINLRKDFKSLKSKVIINVSNLTPSQTSTKLLKYLI